MAKHRANVPHVHARLLTLLRRQGIGSSGMQLGVSFPRSGEHTLAHIDLQVAALLTGMRKRSRRYLPAC